MSRVQLATGVVILLIAGLALSASAMGVTPTKDGPLPQSAFRPIYDSTFVPAPTPVVVGEHVRPHPNPTLPPSPKPKPIVKPVERPVVVVRPRPNGHLVGIATMYCVAEFGNYHTGACMARHPAGGPYAAAGPALRAAIGGGDHCLPGPGCWRDRTVTVCGPKGCATATLADWCRCSGGHVIDLYGTVMKEIDPGYPFNGGVAAAVISW